MLSGYFDRIPSHQNGVCEDEEDEEPASVAAVAVAESSEAEEQAVDPGPDHSLKSCYMKVCFQNANAIRHLKLHFPKCLFTETETIEEFTEPIAVETTEVRLISLCQQRLGY